MKKGHQVTLLVFLVLILDQVLKIWVKTNMSLSEDSFNDWDGWSLSWFRLQFVENPGMAFGLEFGGELGKYALSIFRMVAIGFIIYYINKLIKAGAHTGLVMCVSLILAGAIGNMIDSAFYGVIFTQSSFHSANPAEFVAPFADGHYAGLLQGKVVDMFYFPLWEGHYPSWVPFLGTDHDYCGNPSCSGYFHFFRHVFNIADSSITVGVISILVFQKPFFRSISEEQAETSKDDSEEEPKEVVSTEENIETKKDEESEA